MANYFVHKDYSAAMGDVYNVTHFNSWAAVYNASKSGDTITIAANSGTLYPSEQDLYRNVIVESGSTFAIQRRLFKIKDSITVKAGGSFNVTPHASIATPYTHIDTGKLYIGEENAAVRANMNFDTNSVAALWSSTWTCHNANVIVGDLGAVGSTNFNNSDVEVKGSLAFAAGTQFSMSGRHTMVNSTLTAKGHDLRNDNTYFANNYNRIAYLTMDNSTITIDDKNEDTAADLVFLGSASQKNLIMQNNSLIDIEEGTSTRIINNVSMQNSTINAGDVNLFKTQSISFSDLK